MTSKLWIGLGVWLLAAGWVDASCAATVQFVVDPVRSWLTIAPTANVLGSPLVVTQQAAGSLTANYSGSIYAEVTATTIQLLPETNLVAGNSGSWLPGTGYANYPGDLEDEDGYVNTAVPANYGLTTDLTPLGAVLGKNGLSPSAIRDVRISLYDSAARALVGGEFEEAGIETDFTSGLVFYSSGGTPPITDLASTVFPAALVDVPTFTGRLTDLPEGQMLTIPVSFAVNYNVNFLQLSTQYSGEIVAMAVVPEPSGLALCASAMGCGLALVWRRRRGRR